MSAKISGQVWELDLPHSKLLVLLALADHADHEGNNVFPCMELIEWKTGYTLRNVRRIVADLRDDGILLPYGRTEGGVVVYRIELEHVPRKPAFESRRSRKKRGDILSPDILSPDARVTHNRHKPITKRGISNTVIHNYSSEVVNCKHYDFADDEADPFLNRSLNHD